MTTYAKSVMGAANGRGELRDTEVVQIIMCHGCLMSDYQEWVRSRQTSARDELKASNVLEFLGY